MKKIILPLLIISSSLFAQIDGSTVSLNTNIIWKQNQNSHIEKNFKYPNYIKDILTISVPITANLKLKRIELHYEFEEFEENLNYIFVNYFWNKEPYQKEGQDNYSFYITGTEKIPFEVLNKRKFRNVHIKFIFDKNNEEKNLAIELIKLKKI